MLSETQREHANAVFVRAAEIAEALDERDFRGAYMARHLRTFLADQVRALRGNMSQTAFGRLIGKPQSVVSRLEDEDYGGINFQTLIDIAIKLDIAIIVRFVDYPTFLRVTSDFSENAAAPRPYEQSRDEISDMSKRVQISQSLGIGEQDTRATEGGAGDVAEAARSEAMGFANPLCNRNSIAPNQATEPASELGLAGANVIEMFDHPRTSAAISQNSTSFPQPAPPPLPYGLKRANG